MEKIVNSIRKRPINIILIISVLGLYFFNNKIIKPYTEGMVHIFFTSFFNDLLCPYFFLGYANLLLITCNREMVKFRIIFAVGMTAGFVWEFIAPFLKTGSVTDIGDLVCYAISTVGYWWILNICIKRRGDANA